MLDKEEMMANVNRSHIMRIFSANAVRADLLKYQGPENKRPSFWMDVDVHKSKLLIEFAAYSKVPILSEKEACNVLLTKSAPELPKRLADTGIDRLEPSDIMLEYWYWAYVVSEASEVGMDSKSYCCVTLQSTDSNPYKLRSSWAMPLLVIAEETRYAFPLIDSFKRGDGGQTTAYALADDQTCMLHLDKQRHAFIKLNFPSDYQILVINYRVFDSAVPNWVMQLCFDVLMQKLDFSRELREDGTVEQVDACDNKKRFRKMVEYFLKIPIHVRDDVEYTISKARGIPRGSYFSNLIRTMSNFVMTRMLCCHIFRELPVSQRFHGSKCVLVFESEIKLSLSDYSACAQTYFGIVVDQNRSCIAANVEDFHSLGYCCGNDEYD